MEPENRSIAFIDESYSVPTTTGYRTFYILASAVVPRSRLAELRTELLEAVGTDFMHSTELLKSGDGRQLFEALCQVIPTYVQLRLEVLEPLLPGDKLGESSRRQMFRDTIANIGNDLPGAVREVFFEKRPDGYMRQADSRTIEVLTKDFPDVVVRPTDAAEERLLWLPDILAAAFRQGHLRSNWRYFNLLHDSIVWRHNGAVRLKSKP